MRVTRLVAVPVLLAAAVAPASAQVSARVHVNIPIGREAGVAYGAPRRALTIREYDARRFGGWVDSYNQWQPETVYLYNGYYYDYPIVEWAEPVVVYRDGADFFFAPRAPEFVQWRDRYYPSYRGYAGGGYGYRDVARPRPAPAQEYRGNDVRGRESYRQYDAPRGGERGRPTMAPAPAPQSGHQGSAGGERGGRPAAPPAQGGRSSGHDGGHGRPGNH